MKTPLLTFVTLFAPIVVTFAEEPTPILQRSGSDIEALLGEAPVSGDYKRLEISTSLTDPVWIPLARSFDNTWEPLFPGGFTIHGSPGSEYIMNPGQDELIYFVRYAMLEPESLTSEELASRFLQQATFGPKLSEITALAATNDFAAWIEAQMALPATTHKGLWQGIGSSFDSDADENSHEKGILWFHGSIDAPDQLRQRVAWALAQIFVIGESGSKENSNTEQWVTYYDIFVNNAFGNFRDILQDVTLSAKMGDYLTYVNNRKASGVQKPDENYARESMQLMSIGLWELNQDGTFILDQDGEAIPTYDNSDIETHARVFTGLIYGRNNDNSVNRSLPMVANESRHDTDEKVLVDGTVLSADQTTMEDIGDLLDVLFNHPNTPPFISRLMIQRLICSNPSPGYIKRVADVFVNNGSGVRGDLAAVVKAIYLDPEARNTTLTADDAQGALREPLIRFTHFCRAFNLTSERTDGAYFIRNLEQDFKQFPYRSFSIFNFYLPDHQPNGIVASRGLYSPEFQILDEPSAVKALNVFIELIREGLEREISNKGTPQGLLDYTYEVSIAGDVDALLDHLDLVMLGGRMSASTRTIISDAILAPPEGELPLTDPLERVHRALVLIAASPEFSIVY